MPWTIQPLRPEYAAAAAELHRIGQPGTFLTRLGPTFLAALYAQMAASSHCTGLVALDEAGEALGVVVGSTDTSAVFRELIWQRGLRLVGPVLAALWRDPTLLPWVLRTALYPSQSDADAGASGGGELLYIGVWPAQRGLGIGAALFAGLADALRQRGVPHMGLVVEASNEAARRFYERQGMSARRELALYGRVMVWYELALLPSGQP